MTLFIKVNGLHINHKNFGIESHQLSSVENVQAVITIVDKREICQGCPEIKLSSHNSDLFNSFAHVDKSDTVRHDNCLLLLPTENDKQFSSCKFCKSAKNTLNRKIIRRQQSKNDNYLTIKNLSPSKKKLLKLKVQLKSEGRTKERARNLGMPK